MNSFKNTLNKFYNDFGTYKAMVLSTSLNDKVSSRTVSVIVIDGIFYFQTNKKLKKYNQIKENKNIALSADNISIEGVCYELGLPINNKKFCDLYKEPFFSAYSLYTKSEDEILLSVKPTSIQKWIYGNGNPFIERLDFDTMEYKKVQYQI